MHRQNFSPYSISFWEQIKKKATEEEKERQERNRKIEAQFNKRTLQNPIFNEFSSKACKAVLIELIKFSGCNLLIENDELDLIFNQYLRILSGADNLPENLTNSQTMIFFYTHLQACCKQLAKENFLISKYSIHQVLIPIILVASKLANDLAVYNNDFFEIAEKLNIRMLSKKMVSSLEVAYLNKIGYEVKVTTIDACNVYSKVKVQETACQNLRWTYFFEAYSPYYEETKSIGVYEELFVLRPKL